VQSTAWTGNVSTLINGSARLRIDAPPVSLYGQAGDRAGDVAYDSNYQYYCTADFPDPIVTTCSYFNILPQNTIELNYNNAASLPDLTGYTITGPEYSGTVSFTQEVVGANQFVVPVSPSVEPQNGTYTFTAPAAVIWVRKPWNNAQLTAGSNVLTLNSNGTLTFPDTTVQTTAYQRTTGNWNVAVGSNTYSFTVPVDGTYAMWVRGNIPNGIIAWNATATVTNTNVPVIGQQFAWNYTGGGTPLEFTSIPAQFVGTAGVIVSSNPSVGTTTNTFSFTINNTSGSAQTVYWGYVAQ